MKKQDRNLGDTLEGMLSKWGRRIHLGIAFPLLALVGWRTFTDQGLPAWLNHAQSMVIPHGFYYPALTFVVFVFPILAVSLSIGFLFDRLTRQGKFADKSDKRGGDV